MEPRAHHVLIGLFTLVIATAAVLFALWLSKSGQDTESRNYTVVFEEAVRGLSRGSAVQYNGIRIGDVAELSLDPNDMRKVLALIRIDGTIPVKDDTRARLMLTGVTGSSIIELSGGSPASPLLQAKPGEEYPIIVATPSPLSQLLMNSDNMLTNVTELLLSAKKILSDENVQHVNKTLANIERLTGAFSPDSGDVQAVLHNVAKAAEQASELFEQSKRVVKRADGLVGDQGAQMMVSAQRAFASLDRTANSLEKLVKDNQASIGRGAQGLGEIGPALQSLRAALESVQVLLRRLEDNPANYLLGREKIQEFQP
jgi:phospholipid/cholesterol/gamma-HCH transport system substrate-binding protein